MNTNESLKYKSLGIAEVYDPGPKQYVSAETIVLDELPGHSLVLFEAVKTRVRVPNTNVEVELEPIAIALMDFILGFEAALNKGYAMDRRMMDDHAHAKCLFLLNWPEEYRAIF
jgi:hypothetical protein